MMTGSAEFPELAQRRWDPLVKLTHWGVVAAVIANGLFLEEGSGWHIWVGYTLAALLALRLLWGFVGPAEARFSAFPPSPGKALAHISEIRQGRTSYHRSHNPLGALMAYALWACLGTIVVTGVVMAGPPPANPNISEEGREHGHGDRSDAGPGAYADGDERDDHEGDDDEGDERGEGGEEGEDEGLAQELHELAVNLLYVLVAFHVLGVIFETRRMGRQIVTAMLPGGARKRA